MTILREIVSPYMKKFHTSPRAYDIAIEHCIIEGGFFTFEEYCIAPHEFMKFRSYEYVRMPEDHYGILVLRRRYAERGLLFAGGIVHPGWEGFLVIELYNASSKPITLRRGERPITLLVMEVR